MDPVADMIVAIKNAYMAKKSQVVVPHSKFKFEIARLLEREKFVGKVTKQDLKIHIALIYQDQIPALTEIKRVSKLGLRVYLKAKNIKRFKGGKGAFVISTPKGIMTDKEAKDENLGGEVICQVW